MPTPPLELFYAYARKMASFQKLQALPHNGKPVTSWSNRDAAFWHMDLPPEVEAY